jgi:DNA repair exonuclease SbcCD ATPase subunit
MNPGITLLEITIRNFLSVGNITQIIRLNDNWLTLIIGDNVDVGDTNGCGKTTLLQAISYVIFNVPIMDIKLDNLVNNVNSKGMLVTLKFEANGKSYVLERGRKPSVLNFYIDGERNAAKGTNPNTQEDIEKVIGMSHLMFCHIIALNTYTDPFMKLSAPDKRKVIEELLGITQLSLRAASLKLLMDDTKDKLRDEEARLKANADANTRIKQAIERTEAEAKAWQLSQDRQINALLAKAETMNLIEIETELSIFDQIDIWNGNKKDIDDLRRFAQQEVDTCTSELARLQKEIVRYQDESARVDNGEIARLEAQAKRYLTESEENITVQLNRLASEAARRRKDADAKVAFSEELEKSIVGLREQISNPDSHTCSTCGQGLAGTEHLEAIMKRLSQQLVDQRIQKKRTLIEADTLIDEADGIDGEHEQTKEKHTLKKDEARNKSVAIQQDIKVAKAVLEQQKQIASGRVTELQEMVVGLRAKKLANDGVLKEAVDALVALGGKPVSGYVNRDAVVSIQKERDVLLHQIEAEMAKPNVHLSKMEGLQSTLVVIDYDHLNELNSSLKHEAFLYKLLTAKDSFIRKKIVDQNMMYLNNRLNLYLEKLGLPHEVRFMPDLTVEISLLGHDLDFEQFSRGEANRLILANFWSFRDVWQNLNHPFNLCFIDEVLDSGLSRVGTDAAVQILQDMARDHRKNIFLISHKEHLMETIDNVLVARKEDQFTTFTTQ